MAYQRKNNEASFQWKIVNSVTEDMALAEIPDEVKKAMKLLPQHVDILSKCIKQKPYDLGVLYRGVYCAIELKNVNNSLSFNLDKIETHQLKALRRVVKCGGLGYVLVHFKKGLTKKDRTRLNTEAFAIDIAYICDIMFILKQLKMGNKSLSIEFLIENCESLPYNSFDSIYNLRKLWQKCQKRTK